MREGEGKVMAKTSEKNVGDGWGNEGTEKREENCGRWRCEGGDREREWKEARKEE